MACVISAWIASDVWLLPGVNHAAFTRELLYIPVVINDLQPGQSVISQPHVNEIGCMSAQQFH